MQTEVLELTRDSFTHYISTDIPPEATTRGTYRVQGDTLIFLYEIPPVQRWYRDRLVSGGGSPEQVEEELFYPWRMFIDRLQDQPALWRTRHLRERDRGRAPLNPYALLVYGGPDKESASRSRSCRALRRLNLER